MRLKGTREGQMVGSCKHGDKPKGSTKCGGFFDQLLMKQAGGHRQD